MTAFLIFCSFTIFSIPASRSAWYLKRSTRMRWNWAGMAYTSGTLLLLALASPGEGFVISRRVCCA